MGVVQEEVSGWLRFNRWSEVTRTGENGVIVHSGDSEKWKYGVWYEGECVWFLENSNIHMSLHSYNYNHTDEVYTGLSLENFWIRIDTLKDDNPVYHFSRNNPFPVKKKVIADPKEYEHMSGFGLF